MNSDLIIKQFSVNILIYLVAFKISNVKDINYKKIIKVIIGTIITTTIYAICKGYVNAVFLLIISFTIQCIFLSIIIKDNISIIILNLVSNAITYIIYTLATLIEIIPMVYLKIENNTLNFILITLISLILFILFFFF